MLRSTGLPASSRQVFGSDLREDDYLERRSATWAREPGATAALSADERSLTADASRSKNRRRLGGKCGNRLSELSWVIRRIPVNHLRKAMLEELQRRNLSQITIRIYLRAVEEFAQYFKMSPDRLRPERIRQYQAHLFTDRKLDAISVAQQLSALRFFFLKTLKRPWMVEDMPFPKRPIRLPAVLSQAER